MWKSGPRASKMEPQGLQNGAPGPPKWSPGPPKWGPAPPKWLQVGQKLIRMVVWRSSGTPREPSRPLGSSLGRPRAAKMGANGPQGLPKASQNGAKTGSKSVPKGDQIWSAQKCRFLDNFSAHNRIKFVQILEGICAWIDVCETSKIIKKRDTYCIFEGLAMLDHFKI